MRHISDAQKADRLNAATVGEVTADANAVKFTIKKPVPLPLETVSPEKSAGEIKRLLGVEEGVSVAEKSNGYSVELSGVAKAAYEAVQAAAAARQAHAASATR